MPEGHTTDHSLMEMQTELKAHANYNAFVDLEDNQKSPAAEENGKDKEDKEGYEVEEEETENKAEEEEAAEKEPNVDEAVPEDIKVLPNFPFKNDSIKGHETCRQISCYIVSKQFDYTKEKTLIFNFYKCFTQLSLSQQGKDLTIAPLTDDDEATIAWAKFGLFNMDMWHGDAGPKPMRDIKIEDQKLLHINMTLDDEAC
ncbi:hypothetical protein ARMGADRAFT_1040033 [Armillaria gallica]|uniref:Uncharacterized protein n=1 Tax=Armillaria gallica TaxID=47427 RepID=A0A2H3CWP0_ARMGA|nr:hypothetical protein ARMGADRAFT_1040033 [Armillaria gallica]